MILVDVAAPAADHVAVEVDDQWQWSAGDAAGRGSGRRPAAPSCVPLHEDLLAVDHEAELAGLLAASVTSVRSSSTVRMPTRVARASSDRPSSSNSCTRHVVQGCRAVAPRPPQRGAGHVDRTRPCGRRHGCFAEWQRSRHRGASDTSTCQSIHRRTGRSSRSASHQDARPGGRGDRPQGVPDTITRGTCRARHSSAHVAPKAGGDRRAA